MPASQNELPWTEIDSVLLDMDGTLLDLCYDNHIWNARLPALYAAQQAGSNGSVSAAEIDQARASLHAHMRQVHGTIAYYDLQYWISYTGVDLMALHHEARDLIRYRPGAQAFLEWLGTQGKHRVLATNAHRDSVVIKDQHSALCSALDADFSAHDCGHAKEQPGFWEALQRAFPFDPQRTLFIDDNEAVLDSAQRYGVAHLRMVSQPDSTAANREHLAYPAFNDFRELMPAREAL
ncbi:MAG: HAD-IA family hydrolase [Pseudomonadota bacterium]